MLERRPAETGAAGPPAAAPAFELYPPRSAAGLDPRTPATVAARLDALLAHHRTLPARRGRGGLFLVDIGELGRRFARRWPQAREKAYQLVEGILARRLGANDLYVALPAERFLLLLTDQERAAAELLARRIASEITDRLCGMIPGGVACRLRTLPLDLDTALADARSSAALEAIVAAAEAPAESPADTALAALAGRLEPHFAPVLNVRKRLVSIYALDTVTKVAGMPVPRPDPKAGGADETAALDRWHVAQAASMLAAPGFRAALLIPVDYATLAGMRHREPLMLACRRLPPRARRRLLVELRNVPPTLPQPRLRELVSYLRPFTLGVTARVVSARLDGRGTGPRGVVAPLVEQLAGSGVVGLSLDLADAAAAPSGGTEPGPAALPALLVATAGRLGLRTFCHVGADARLCRAALAAGLDHVLGEALLPSSRRPGRVVAHGHTAG